MSLPVPQLHDGDPMPFGTYRGVRLGDVPAAHLLLVRAQLRRRQLPRAVAYVDRQAVAAYIDANRALLEAEAAAPPPVAGTRPAEYVRPSPKTTIHYARGPQ